MGVTKVSVSKPHQYNWRIIYCTYVGTLSDHSVQATKESLLTLVLRMFLYELVKGKNPESTLFVAHLVLTIPDRTNF